MKTRPSQILISIVSVENDDDEGCEDFRQCKTAVFLGISGSTFVAGIDRVA
jgi:hypothetical protein